MKLRISTSPGCTYHTPKHIRMEALVTQFMLIAEAFKLNGWQSLNDRQITLTVHKPVRKRYVRVLVTERTPDTSNYAWIRAKVDGGDNIPTLVCSRNLQQALEVDFIPPHFYVVLHPVKRDAPA